MSTRMELRVLKPWGFSFPKSEPITQVLVLNFHGMCLKVSCLCKSQVGEFPFLLQVIILLPLFQLLLRRKIATQLSL